MAPPRKKNGSIDWGEMHAKGENPNGMMAQTADGTVRNCDAMPPQDYHYNQSADGERWNDGFQKPTVIEVLPGSKSRKSRY